MLISLLVFFVILSVLVIIHELGHYLVAKKLNIKVEEFGFGFPPKAFGIKRGETEYTINWLPIGGFVKLYGEDEAGGGRITASDQGSKTKDKTDLKRAFFSRSPGQRAAVVVAGVVMNVLLAAIIYYVFLGFSGFKTELPLLGRHDFFLVNQTVKSDVIISNVAPKSPAAEAKIPTNVRLVSVNGEKLSDSNAFAKVITSNKGKEITLVYQDLLSQKTTSIRVIPRVNPPKGEGALGVAFFSFSTVTLSYDTPVQRILSGFSHPANMMVYQFDILGKLIGVSVQEKTTEPLGEAVSGPVGIYNVVGQFLEIPDTKQRILQLLNLAGLLSASLAVFNILPIPALDGGRLAFIMVEWIFKKKVDPKVEGYIHQVGMIVLLGLIVLVTFKDIGALFR